MHGSDRKLLWVSSSRAPYLDVPKWLEEMLTESFPGMRVVIGRDEETVNREIEDAEIFVSWKLLPEQFARCRKLRWVLSTSAGVGQILIPALVASSVIVTNATTVHAIPVAEHAIALIFALSRRLADSFKYQSKSTWGHAAIWHGAHLPGELNGATLGLVGLGAIGGEIARRARALDMRVVAVKRNLSRGGDLADRIYPPGQLSRMLEAADYIVLAAPETPETRHIIGGSELRMMKRTACVINVSRGALIDTAALIGALREGTLAGAALDVTDPEPLPDGHPIWNAPNIFITHHTGSATGRLWLRQSELFHNNLRRYLAGEPMLNLVEKQRGY